MKSSQSFGLCQHLFAISRQHLWEFWIETLKFSLKELWENFYCIWILGFLASWQQKYSVIYVKMKDISCFVQFSKIELKSSEPKLIMSIVESKKKMDVNDNENH